MGQGGLLIVPSEHQCSTQGADGRDSALPARHTPLAGLSFLCLHADSPHLTCADTVFSRKCHSNPLIYRLAHFWKRKLSYQVKQCLSRSDSALEDAAVTLSVPVSEDGSGAEPQTALV